MVKVLPQSLTIFSKRNLKDSLFERQSSLILIADKENRCFMYPIPTGNECSFEGFYKIEENELEPDSGTLWECGYAIANNVPVIGVRNMTDEQRKELSDRAKARFAK